MKNKYFRSAAAFALAVIVACGTLTGCTGTKGKQQNDQKPQSSVTQQEQSKKPAQKPAQKPEQEEDNKGKVDQEKDSEDKADQEKDNKDETGKKPGSNKKPT